MKYIIVITLVLNMLLVVSCKERSFRIDKNEISLISIVIPDTANSITRFAAAELKKHLDLVFNVDIAITDLSDKNNFKRQLLIGIKPNGFNRVLKPEEAVYIIDGNSIYLFGDDNIARPYTDDRPGELMNRELSEVLDLSFTRTGTLSAVYSFLENELGIRWIKPGDDGIFFPDQITVTFQNKEFNWSPSLIQRNIRTGNFTFNEQQLYSKYAHVEFHLTRNISEKTREYIKRMLIVNEHSRLTFIIFMAGKKGDKKEIIARATDLINYRIQNKDKVDINWNVLFQYQHYQMGDQIGTKYLGYLPTDPNPNDF